MLDSGVQQSDSVIHIHISFFIIGYYKILNVEGLLNLLIFLKFILFLAVLGLRCCAWAFSSCGEWVSHCSGFSCCGARALGARAPVVVACGL